MAHSSLADVGKSNFLVLCLTNVILTLEYSLKSEIGYLRAIVEIILISTPLRAKSTTSVFKLGILSKNGTRNNNVTFMGCAYLRFKDVSTSPIAAKYFNAILWAN